VTGRSAFPAIQVVPFGYPAPITAYKFTGWGRKALVELFAIPVSESFF
jgi:hypothetical protein